MNQGIRAIREFSQNNPDETRSMILFGEGYTQDQIDAVKASVEKFGGNLVLVNNVDEMFDYINKSDRAQDKISNLEIYSHGHPDIIEFGYRMKNAASLSIGVDNVSRFNSNSFNLGATITSYACRTALGNNSSVVTFSRDCDQSLAQKIANAAKVDVFGFASRTSYAGTLGSTLDRHPWTAAFMPLGVLPVPIPETKLISGAAFTPNGANRGVCAGDFPLGGGVFIQHLTPQ